MRGVNLVVIFFGKRIAIGFKPQKLCFLMRYKQLSYNRFAKHQRHKICLSATPYEA